MDAAAVPDTLRVGGHLGRKAPTRPLLQQEDATRTVTDNLCYFLPDLPAGKLPVASAFVLRAGPEVGWIKELHPRQRRLLLCVCGGGACGPTQRRPACAHVRLSLTQSHDHGEKR